MRKIKQGGLFDQKIIEVNTRKILFSEFIVNHKNGIIYYDGSTYTHIAGNEFVLSGLMYGDDESHYIKINNEHVMYVTNTFTDSGFDICSINRDIKTKNVPVKTYVMFDKSTGFYKIGKSVNPRYREKTLQSEKPTIELLHVFHTNIEKKLHKEYHNKRIRGEWFALEISDIEKMVTNAIKNGWIKTESDVLKAIESV